MAVRTMTELYQSFYNGKRVLVTGHTGFMGTWLCKTLSMMGADVYGYALAPETDPCIFRILRGEEWIRSVTGDIRNYDKLYACVKDASPELVFHLAAQPIVRESYRFPRETFETNVMGTVNLLECVRSIPGVQGILNVTTDKVYENETGEARAFTEDDKLGGHDPYAGSKCCSELATLAYKRSFFSDCDCVAVATVRAGNVIGGGDFSVDRIIPDCVRAVTDGKRIFVRNPFSSRPYQHVLEAVNAYLLIMMMQVKDRRFAGAYNIGPDADGTTTGDLADLFAGLWGNGAGWYTAAEQNAPFEAAALSLDCARLKETFGWQQTWSLYDAIKAAVDWYRAWNDQGDCMRETEKQISAFFQQSAVSGNGP